MTKVSVFGQQPTETKELKKIELIFSMNHLGNWAAATRSAAEYSNIMLIEKSYFENDRSLILAWDDLNNTILYQGNWNDGVV